MENWIAAGLLAIVSLTLPVGWQWLKKRLTSAEWFRQRWLGRTADFFYFVGLPYLALVFGLLTPQLMGLKGLGYFNLISVHSLIPDLQRAITLMLVEWLVDAGPMIGIGLVAVLILGGVIFVLTRFGIVEAQSSEKILDTVFYTLHWVFYWALFWLLVDDLYLGVLFGSGWVILEWFLIARMQQTWFGRQPQQLVEVMILILTATTFFYRPNLWLLWIIHLVMVLSTRLISATAVKSKHIENSL